MFVYELRGYGFESRWCQLLLLLSLLLLSVLLLIIFLRENKFQQHHFPLPTRSHLIAKPHQVSMFVCFFCCFLIICIICIYVFYLIGNPFKVQRRIQSPGKYLRWSFFAKIIYGLQLFTILANKVRRGYWVLNTLLR